MESQHLRSSDCLVTINTDSYPCIPEVPKGKMRETSSHLHMASVEQV